MLLALSIAWAALFGGPGDDRVTGVVTAPDGGAYACATTDATAYGGQVALLRYSSTGTLVWQRSLGSGEARGIAVASGGDVVVTGHFGVSSIDGFVARVSPAGAQRWRVTLGGSLQDWPQAIVATADGGCIVAGLTASRNYPVTAGAIRTSRPYVFADVTDGMVTKLDVAGRVSWSTYFGTGNSSDLINALALDPAGNPVLVGATGSSLFPVTPGAFDVTKDYFKDGFVAKIAGDGRSILWAGYLGADNADDPRGVAVDDLGAVYVTGYTASARWPLFGTALQSAYAGGIHDGFFTKLAADGSRYLNSTYLGSPADDRPQAIGVGSEVVIAGNVLSGGSTNIEVTRLTLAGGLISRERLGSAATVIDLDESYIVGRATGTFQGQPVSGSSDGFILKLGSEASSPFVVSAPAAAGQLRIKLVDVQGREVKGKPPPGVYFRLTIRGSEVVSRKKIVVR